MFDDPKKELKRLQEQLLAAEEEQWTVPEETEEVFEEEEPEASNGRFLREEIPPEPVEEEGQTSEKSRIPFLVAALLVEVAALLGVLAWWLLWR